MDHREPSEVEELLDQLPTKIADAIKEGDSDIDELDELEFGDASLPYPYNLEGAKQSSP